MSNEETVAISNQQMENLTENSCETPKTINYFIYAKDFSCSTDKEEYYHSNGLKTLEQFNSDVTRIKNELANDGESSTESKIIYLHWGSVCDEVDEETTRKTYLQQIGKHGATIPYKIINWLQENYDICGENSKIKLLYIITDGLVNDHCVEVCYELNENMHYETVVFHAFNKNVNQINLSVASSFFKCHCIAYCNNELYDNTNIYDEFDYHKIKVDNFYLELDDLKSYIKLKYLRKSIRNTGQALEEVDKLKRLRTRLFDELISSMPEDTQSQMKHKFNLDTKDKKVFIQEFAHSDWYKALTTDVQSKKVEFEKTITTLINYIISENKSYSFDALKFNKEYRKPIEEEVIVDVNFTVEQEIEFPDIILEDEKGVPVVILTKLNLLDKIIFHGQDPCAEVQPASFSKFKSTMDCPLYLVNDKDISESIGYFYTFNVYKQFLATNTKKEPRTRKPFHGGLVLTDTDLFDKYNDYILAATYFDCKKVNFNVGLFYYILWKNCENKQWMDKNVIEQFKKYAMRRISTTVCKIGLSSLPLDPPHNTSLLTALWYCVELSSYIFKDDNQNFFQERLRMFYGVAYCMVEILKYFDYDLDLKFIEKRRELLSHVMIMKKISKQTDKVYYLLEKIFRTVDGFLISEIEKPFNLYKLNYLKLNHKKMLSDAIVEETVHLNDYVHLMDYVGDLDKSKAGESTFEICDKTLRPFFAIDKNKSFYSDLIKCTKRVVINDDDDKDKIKICFEPADSLEFDKILSLYNLFIHCVKDLEKYPTLQEYMEYVLKRKKFHEDLVTIFPSNVHYDISNVYECYQKAVTNVEVEKFIKITKSYANRTERVKAEERVKFNDKNEINEFISNEELKVNLKKKT